MIKIKETADKLAKLHLFSRATGLRTVKAQAAIIADCPPEILVDVVTEVAFRIAELKEQGFTFDSELPALAGEAK